METKLSTSFSIWSQFLLLQYLFVHTSKYFMAHPHNCHLNPALFVLPPTWSPQPSFFYFCWKLFNIVLFLLMFAFFFFPDPQSRCSVFSHWYAVPSSRRQHPLVLSSSTVNPSHLFNAFSEGFSEVFFFFFACNTHVKQPQAWKIYCPPMGNGCL